MVSDHERWTSRTVIELQQDGLLLVEDGNHGEYRPRSDEFSDIGTLFIRAADMSDGRVLFETAQKINDVAMNRIRKGIGASGDVILSHKGTVGKVGYVPLDAPPFVCSPQTTFWRTLDNNTIDRRYLFSFLKSHYFKQQLYSLANETDMAAYVSLTSQRSLSIVVPPIEVQRSIAGTLGSLDDKIELNRRMNGTLEGMAQALFKSWFVDFDPVIDNALVAGNPLPDELAEGAGWAERVETRRQALATGSANRQDAQAFPAAFQLTEEMGWIPAGWEVSSLKDCTSKIGSGSTPRGGSSAYIDEGTRLVRSQNVYDSSFQWAGIVCITDEAAEKLKSVALTERDVLINITGDSILRTCIVDPSVLPARVNQHVAILRPKDKIPTPYLHQYIVRSEYKTYLLGFDAGGSRQAITKGHLEEAKILLPCDFILKTYSSVVDTFFDRINRNNLQTRNLENLRDTLLPKLISGELRIPDAEKLAEEALA